MKPDGLGWGSLQLSIPHWVLIRSHVWPRRSQFERIWVKSLLAKRSPVCIRHDETVAKEKEHTSTSGWKMNEFLTHLLRRKKNKSRISIEWSWNTHSAFTNDWCRLKLGNRKFFIWTTPSLTAHPRSIRPGMSVCLSFPTSVCSAERLTVWGDPSSHLRSWLWKQDGWKWWGAWLSQTPILISFNFLFFALLVFINVE